MSASRTLNKSLEAYQPLGLTAPKAATAALAEWHRIVEWRTGIAEPRNLVGLTFEERTALLERQALRTWVTQLPSDVFADHEAAICGPGLNALYADADRVIGKLAARYTNAAVVITTALGYYSADDFADPAALYAKGREAAATAYSVRDASAELELIRNLVEQLIGKIGDGSARSVAAFVDLIDGAPDDTLAKAVAAFRGPSRWTALLATPGVVPALHTHDQAAGVVARSTEAKRATEAAAEAERRRLQQERKDRLKAEREQDTAGRLVKLS